MTLPEMTDTLQSSLSSVRMTFTCGSHLCEGRGHNIANGQVLAGCVYTWVDAVLCKVCRK